MSDRFGVEMQRLLRAVGRRRLVLVVAMSAFCIGMAASTVFLSKLMASTAWTSWYYWSGMAAALLFAMVFALILSESTAAARLASQLTQTNQRLETEIAERKQIESDLSASENRYKALFESSTDAIILRSPDLRMIAANRAAVALFHCRHEIELADTVPLGVSPEYQPDGIRSADKLEQLWKLAKQEGAQSFEWLYRRKDGTQFLANVSLTYTDMKGGPFLQATIRDITEQKLLEERLRTSERQLRLFADNVSDVLWTMDLSGKFTYLSPSIEQLMGVSWNAQMPLTLEELMPEASRAAAQKALKDYVEQLESGGRPGPACIEMELIRPDGSSLWVEVTIGGIYDESGRGVGMAGVTRDVTARHAMEQRQTQLRRRLEGVNRLQEQLLLPAALDEKFKQITDAAVALMDLDFCRVWMIRPGDLCDAGCPHAAATDPVHVCRFRGGCLHLVASSGRYTNLDGSHRRVPFDAYKIGRIASGRDNKFLTNDVTHDPRVHDHPWAEQLGLVSFAGYKLRDSDGKPIGVLGVFAKHPLSEEDDAFLANLAETTSRVIMDGNIREALGRENAKLSAMISGMDEGVVFADADNVIVEINDYMCRFLGRSREEVVGRRIEECHGGEVLKNVMEHVAQFRENVNSAPFVIQRAFGSTDVILRMQPIYRNHRYDGVLLNVIDVSALVKARREADEANQAKSRFLASMSHEIRTPMTAILGYADLLMDPAINASNRLNYASTIRRSGEHLLALINDVLDLSKIEAGKMPLELDRCNLTAILAEVASMLRPRAAQRGVSFSVEYPGPMPSTILTDGTRLRQAIFNLAGNAVKFTEQGSVRLVAKFLPQWCGNQPGIQIEVIDTGIGIRPESLPKLFQPFSQADDSIAQRFGGTGLGLVISRHIAHMLGGELTVSSVWGQGSTFTLRVPTGNLRDVPMMHHPSEAERESGGRAWQPTSEDLRGVRILLAEDGYDNRELIRTILQKAGAEIEAVENGQLAVHRALEEPFDIILMDMNMPVMDGYEATRLLRSKGYKKPIYALTANAMSDDCGQCLGAGCDEYLTKPITRARLVGAIAAGLGRPLVTETTTVAPAGTGEGIVSQFIDDPEIASILPGFIARLAEQLETMRRAQAAEDYEELRRLAHKLKGAGGSYGYPSLSEAAAAMEETARMQDSAAVAAAMNTISALIRAVEDGFAAAAIVEKVLP